jgi:DNA repair exonuclease SbcCD nuclease subunit
MKYLVVGDTHFKVDNVEESEHFHLQVYRYLLDNKVDCIILLGDLLHTHEKLFTFALNLAVKFITMCSSFAHTYCLVGNHDATSNTIYCSTNHWMNVLKNQTNVTVVDKPTPVMLGSHGPLVLACPYVSDGRFVESLNEFAPGWQQANLIFAHQLFDGAKMGAIVSQGVEEWKLEWPQVISGHLHDRQQPQANLYYTGSSQQLAFTEKEDKSLALVSVSQSDSTAKWTSKWTEVFLDIKHRKIIHATVSELSTLVIPVSSDTTYKIVIQDDDASIKAFKKTERYKELENRAGVKSVQFKVDKCGTVGVSAANPMDTPPTTDFVTQLMNNLNQLHGDDAYLESYVKSIVLNRKEIDCSDKDVLLLHGGT